MASPFPGFNLKALNLIIAMCQGDSQVPRVLHDNGYMVWWVEQPFRSSDDSVVKPEILTASSHVRHAIMWEWKSGGNLDQGQLGRYLAVRPEDVAQGAWVEPQACERVGPAVVVPDGLGSRCSGLLAEWEMEAPLLELSDTQIRLSASRFGIPELDGPLQQGLSIRRIPVSYVPFDRDAPDYVIVEHLMRLVLQTMWQRRPRLELGEAIFRTWRVLAPSMRGELDKRMGQLMGDLAANELARYLKRDKTVQAQATHTPTWIVIGNPFLDPGKDAAVASRAFRKATEAALFRHRGGRLQFALLDLDGQDDAPAGHDEPEA